MCQSAVTLLDPACRQRETKRQGINYPWPANPDRRGICRAFVVKMDNENNQFLLAPKPRVLIFVRILFRCLSMHEFICSNACVLVKKKRENAGVENHSCSGKR